MTTFQAIIYAIIDGVTQFLPMSAKAHHILVPYLIGWQPPSEMLIGALSLGSLLALLGYFRHDWASMISCFLQVIIYRKRPMTLDERLPLFLGLSTLPVLFASSYFRSEISEIDWNPPLVAAVLAVMGLPLLFFDNFSRKTKGMFDWKWIDAFVVGITQASAIIPGWDPMSGALLGAFFLNYKRESATKYAYFTLAPLLIIRTFSHLEGLSFHNSAPSPELSWLSFGVAMVVALFVGVLAIGGFLKHVQQRGMARYVVYRWVLAAGALGLYWLRTRA